jgi:DNA replication protein DnaC
MGRGEIGPSKTHLSTAIAIEACSQLIKTRFVIVCAFINDFMKARDEKSWGRVIK